MNDVVLSIAIPTYNRAKWLKICLEQLLPQVNAIGNSVEVTVYDNASPDNTSQVVQSFLDQGFPLSYRRNNENIGSDRNIAQCFNIAQGQYVLILGDDDLFVDGGLADLLSKLRTLEYGVVCLKPYGFNDDFRNEYPGKYGSDRLYESAGLFLAAIGPLMTLISGCVINKSLLPKVDANDYCGENLVQVHLVIQAAIAGKYNLFMNRYIMACKRNNSGGYDFAKVFVENVGRILDQYTGVGLTRYDVLCVERKFIMGYFPFYLMKQRLDQNVDIDAVYRRFSARYGDRSIFYFWLYPILKFPRWLAIGWGGIVTLVGRSINGDLLRGISFAVNKINATSKFFGK